MTTSAPRKTRVETWPEPTIDAVKNQIFPNSVKKEFGTYNEMFTTKKL